MRVFEAKREELPVAAALAAELWRHHTAEDMAQDLRAVAAQGGAVFLAEEDGAPVGFAQAQLRHDYVEGADASPVGYLEGIYVREAHRHQGIARALLAACESWAKAQGCAEFASDCELDNSESLAFHLKSGFTEANRIICFIKKLNGGQTE